MSFTEHEVGPLPSETDGNADPPVFVAPKHLPYLLVAVISFLVPLAGLIMAVGYNKKVKRHNEQAGAPKISASNYWLAFGVSAALALAALAFVNLRQDNLNNATFTVVGTGPVAPTVQPSQEAPPAASQAPDTAASDLISTLSSKSNFVLTRPGGYSFNVDVAAGQAQHLDASASLTVGGRTLTAGSACRVDRSADAGVPFTITVTNTTPSFTASAHYFVRVVQSDQRLGGTRPELELAVGDGETSTCYSEDGTQLTHGQQSPGASSSLAGFVIIHNYFSPNAPQGDSQLWRDTALSFNGSLDDQRNVFTAGSASGTGVVGTKLIGVPLDGQIEGWLKNIYP